MIVADVGAPGCAVSILAILLQPTEEKIPAYGG
jgi:hypothetical protein